MLLFLMRRHTPPYCLRHFRRRRHLLVMLRRFVDVTLLMRVPHDFTLPPTCRRLRV